MGRACINRAYKVRATKQKAGSRGGQTKQSRDWRGRQKPRRAATADSITMIPTSRVPSLGVTRSYDPRHRTGQRQRWLWERVLEPPLKVVYSGDAHHARARHAATPLGPLAIPAPAPRALSAPSPSGCPPSYHHHHHLSLLRARIPQRPRTFERPPGWTTRCMTAPACCSRCWVSSSFSFSFLLNVMGGDCGINESSGSRSSGGEPVDSTGRLREVAAGL